MISFFLKNVSCTYFVYLLTMTNAHALPQKKDIAEKSTKQDVQLSFVPSNEGRHSPETPRRSQNITSEEIESLNLSLVTENNNHIDFKKLKPKNKIKQIKERYLTLYSDKKEQLKATYLQGAYAINYTQSW